MSETNRRKFLAAAGAGAAAGVVGITAGPAFGGSARSDKAARRRSSPMSRTTAPRAPSRCWSASARSSSTTATWSRGSSTRQEASEMSSHREAPEISKDPVADGTDIYAFVSPDKPGTVTLIANFIPLQTPDGGPNFYEFGDDVLYDIHIANSGKGRGGHHLPLPVHDQGPQPEDVPLQHGADQQHRRPQLEPAAVLHGHPHRGRPQQADRQEHALSAGQRRQAEHARLRRARQPGGALDRRPQGLRGPARRRVPRRPRQHLRPRGAPAVQRAHLISMPDTTASTGCRRSTCTRSRCRCRSRPEPQRGPRRPEEAQSVIGVWATASRRSRGCGTRRRARTSATGRGSRCPGSGTRCSTRCSCRWPRRTGGTTSSRRTTAVREVREQAGASRAAAGALPGVFPNLAAYTKPRADLNAILLTGIPSGVVPGFQNFTGPVESDMLRLNVAIPPPEAQRPRPGGR